MKLSEEKLRQIILEETQKYLEEIEGRLSPQDFEKFMQRYSTSLSHKPKYDPPETPQEQHDQSEVFFMVYGETRGDVVMEKPLEDWPLCHGTRPCADLLAVQRYLTRVHGVPYSDIIDEDGDPTMKHPWNYVKALASIHMKDIDKIKQQQKLQRGEKESSMALQKNIEKQRDLRKLGVTLENIIKEEIIKYLKENE